jgi:ABC-2 type transport system permease protein
MRFLSIIIANFKMTLRNKQALFFLFVFPLLFMGLFGVILGDGQGSSTIAVVKQADSQTVARLYSALKELDKNEAFTVKTLSKTAAINELKAAKVDAVIVLKSKKDKALAVQTGSQPSTRPQSGTFAGEIAVAEVYYDNASMQSQMMQGSVAAIIGKIERSMVQAPSMIETKSFSIQVKHSSYIDFLLPGILAMSLMNSGLYGISASMVARREKGVLRRLKLTPMPLAEFIGAGIINQLIVSMVQSALLVAVGYFGFGVRITGGITLTVFLIILGSLCFITLGFTIASFAKTADAANAIGNFIGMPMMFLGGVFFPVDTAPAWIQPIVKTMPLKYLADSLRSVMINNETFVSVQSNVLILLAITIVLFAVSVKFFKWESGNS